MDNIQEVKEEIPFDIYDWYWIFPNGKVFSSISMAYVDVYSSVRLTNMGAEFELVDTFIRYGIQGWDAVYGVDSVIPRRHKKLLRGEKIDNIVVTTSTGKSFDGDEISQTRMTRALVGMQAANVPSIQWVLANNTLATVTDNELAEALILAGQEQSRLWTL